MLRRVTLGLLAALVLLVGAACGTAAVWMALVLAPTDGVLRYPVGTIQPGPEAAALIIDVDRFDADVPYVGALGESTLVASTSPVTELFLGAAPTPEADGYLVGVPYAVAVRVAGEWEVRAVPGAVAPAPPSEQDIWLTSEQGTRPAISLPATRPLTLVLLRPDGGPVETVEIGVDFTVAEVARDILWLSVAAVVLVLLGLLLVFFAIQRVRPGRHVAPKPERGRHAAGRRDTREVSDEQPVG